MIRIGPGGYLAAERLLRAHTDHDVDALGAAFASLFATTPEQWTEIETLFRRHILEGTGTPEAARGATGRAAQSRPDGTAAAVDEPRRTVRVVAPCQPSFVERCRARVASLVAAGRRRFLDAPRRLLAAGLAAGCLATALVPIGVDWLFRDQVITPGSPGPGGGERSSETRSGSAESSEAWIPWPLTVVVPERSVHVDPPSRLYPYAGASLLALLFGLRLLLVPPVAERARAAKVKARRKVAAAARAELEARQEPLELRYAVVRHPVVSAQATLDSAELLGRVFREERGIEIDTSRTLARTVRAGGRFTAVLAGRRIRQDVLVLVDVEQGDHPWLGGFERLLDAWRTLGVRMVRYDFRLNPASLTEAGTRRPIPIEELARRTEGMPVVLFSRRIEPDSMAGRAAWLNAINLWPTRVWIDPTPRFADDLDPVRRHAVKTLVALGLPRFVFSDRGVVAAARWLASEGQSLLPAPPPPVPPLDAADPPVQQALRRWAVAGAIVPDPTWDQLEAIRRELREVGDALPAYACVQLLLEWVHRETGRVPERSGGSGLAIPEEFQTRWLAVERRDESGRQFEQHVRRLLLRQLASTEPTGELQRLWWRFKRSQHQAILEPHRAVELLGWIYDSPIEHEAARWVDGELARQLAVPNGVQFSTAARDAFTMAADGGRGVTPKEAVWGHPAVWSRALVGSGVAALLLSGLAGWSTTSRVLPATLVLMDPGDLAVPQMVRMEGGTFSMGSDGGDPDELPVHAVTIGPFEISRTEVTVAQYRACVEAGACAVPDTSGGCTWDAEATDDHPINCVSWDAAAGFAGWLGMRLPTETEWEYAARGQGANVAYPWGDEEASCETAVLSGCADGPRPVCSVPAGNTVQGLCDMAGNVWEWVEDDWHGDYRGAPADGTAWVDSPRGGDRVVRGGSWGSDPQVARAAARHGDVPAFRIDDLSFRVARSLPD